ncbi:ATP synthase F1 subunit epsilon [Zongyangia hominis]|uniref:ATP synthase epsilon chain n=1 Tax=Zongyangia hominis TaxID=2763677 RepID=A0A926IB76_9FIRM|nr:ATP synthase F1 subunit epsilon [Zongyangia hominis]MBC8569835.1 ATP synthase F1 subunit epsilon [Zongyangia hominis]
MAAFHLQIVTPDGLKFDGDSEEIVVRTVSGDVGILAGHISYMAPIAVGELRVKRDGAFRSAAVSGGFVSTDGKETQIICTTCEWADEIDEERAKKARELAEQRLKEKLSARELSLAEAKLSRAINRLKVSAKR